jgi:glutathione synthase/RimK-type ligase-like ATP-grasp enzyme
VKTAAQCCKDHPWDLWNRIIFRMDALRRLEKLGVRVVSSAAAIERTVDKCYTSFLLSMQASSPTHSGHRGL